MLLLGTVNTIDQAIAINEPVNLGTIYRRYDKRNCGVRTFELSGNSIALQVSGIYHLTATIETAAATTFQLFEDGVANTNAVTTTGVLDTYVLVNNSGTLNTAKTISIVNTEAATTVTNIIVNIEKVV